MLNLSQKVSPAPPHTLLFWSLHLVHPDLAPSQAHNLHDKPLKFLLESLLIQDILLVLNQDLMLHKYKYLVLSYNSEGIMPQEEIISTLSKYGKVILKQFEYARYKSNNKGLSKTKKTVLEQLYILEYGK